MSKTCIVKFNEQLARWEALYSGRVLASSKDAAGGPEYLKKVIEGGFSQKAKNFNVTKCEVIGSHPGADVRSESDLAVLANGEPAAPVATVESEFPINERFLIMQDYTDMVGKREMASALVTGEGGLGKTFTVMKSLRDAGIQDVSKMEIGARFDGQRGYVVVKGYSTAKGLFRTLYENRNQIIVFDDCDNVLKDPTAVNILKAALDSYDVRMVTWNAEGWGSDEDLPKSFEFTGGVIFISNLPKHKVPQAIRSRAMCADVSMTRAEVIERMRMIVTSPEFMPDFDDEMKLESLEFVAENANNPMITELNLRSLVNVIKARAAKPDHWRRLGLYSMANS
jgi:hypothetical protein